MRAVLLLLFTLLTVAQAEEYKAVFDCSSNKASYIASRMMLVERTMSMIEKRGNKPVFAITLHGGCVPIVSKNYDEIFMDEEDMLSIQRAQESIIRLSKKKGVEITACAIALNANAIAQEDVLPFVHISENSFIDTIAYQNCGYALMTFK